MKAAGSTYFRKFEDQLQTYEDAMDGLKETLQTIAQCTRSNDGDGIPERAAINSTQELNEHGQVEDDVGKSLRSLANHTQQAKVTLPFLCGEAVLRICMSALVPRVRCDRQGRRQRC